VAKSYPACPSLLFRKTILVREFTSECGASGPISDVSVRKRGFSSPDESESLEVKKYMSSDCSFSAVNIFNFLI
jgi:hypothetical protein